MGISDQLTRALARAGIPIDGVSFPKLEDRSTWQVHYQPQASAAQRAQGQTILETFDATTDAAGMDEQALGRFNDEKLIQAVARWTAQKLNVPLATARAEILAIYKSLL